MAVPAWSHTFAYVPTFAYKTASSNNIHSRKAHRDSLMHSPVELRYVPERHAVQTEEEEAPVRAAAATAHSDVRESGAMR